MGLCDFIDFVGVLAGDDFMDLCGGDTLRLLFIFMGDFFVGDTFVLFAATFLPEIAIQESKYLLTMPCN